MERGAVQAQARSKVKKQDRNRLMLRPLHEVRLESVRNLGINFWFLEKLESIFPEEKDNQSMCFSYFVVTSPPFAKDDYGYQYQSSVYPRW